MSPKPLNPHSWLLDEWISRTEQPPRAKPKLGARSQACAKGRISVTPKPKLEAGRLATWQREWRLASMTPLPLHLVVPGNSVLLPSSTLVLLYPSLPPTSYPHFKMIHSLGGGGGATGLVLNHTGERECLGRIQCGSDCSDTASCE